MRKLDDHIGLAKEANRQLRAIGAPYPPGYLVPTPQRLFLYRSTHFSVAQ
jgi:hypothetical protein